MKNVVKQINYISRRFGVFVFVILLAQASTNYKLQSYGFGSGGVGDSTSGNYGLNAISGEVSENQLSSGTYKANPGIEFTQMANEPPAPTFVNTTGYWYDQLHFVVTTGGNPTDTLYVIGISTDNFVTTNYIQADDTVGATAVYQTYTNWGGASGENVLGLQPSTAYKIKVRAKQGKYSESGWGPVGSASTSGPSMIFDIDVSATDSETDPPYIVDFGNLAVGSVNDSPVKVWIDFETNADNGGNVFVYGLNGSLRSAGVLYSINSATGDLSSLTEGYGARGLSNTQGSGGPLNIVSPYNGSSNNVGVLDTTIRTIFSSTAPVFSGRGSFILKSKITNTTPAASDYTDTITAISSAAF